MNTGLNGNFQAVCAVVVLMATGCFSGCTSKTTPAGTVSGQVTIDGKPVDSGIIQFHEPTQGNLAGGQLEGPQGRYELTFGGLRQIPAGSYLVTISPAPQTEYDAVSGTLAPSSADTRSQDRQIPGKYHRHETSGLTATVTSGENNFNFELKSK